TSLLTEGLVARGHDVTLFATAGSKTRAKLHATFPRGYWDDQAMWPWELYEMMNLAAAVEQAAAFDIIHYEAMYYPMSLAFTRLILAAAKDDYYRAHVAPHVDGTRVVYHGEADHATKVQLYGGARALLYPVQAGEPFGLVMVEAMACGTPVAALDKGAVREVV